MSVTLIAGSRGIDNEAEVHDILDHLYNTPTIRSITEVIQGGARGVDRLAATWAHKVGFPVVTYWADWSNKGKAAGFIRNQEMANKCEQAIVLWDGDSPGTKSMIDLLFNRRKPVVVCVIPTEHVAEL